MIKINFQMRAKPSLGKQVVISQLKDYVPDFQVKNQLQSFLEEILVLPPFDKLF